MADMRNKWTKDDDAIIIANVGKLTYADIAVRLGTGVSKAQVARRAKHLGLAGTDDNPVRSKGNPGGGRKAVRRAPDSKGSAKGGSFQQVVLREPVPVPVAGLVCEPVSMLERGEFQCGWPLDGGMCCGLRVMGPYVNDRTGRRVTPPYCPAHQNHATQPSKYQRGIWRGP